jgi:hypothetical protein
VEVHKTVVSLDILNAKLDLTEGKCFIIVQVRQRKLNDSALHSTETILVPFVFVMRVLPQFLTENMDGATSWYYSFLRKGSTLLWRTCWCRLGYK